MAEESSLKPFFVYLPYYRDAGVLSRRKPIRPRHMEQIAHLVETGVMRVGGFLTDAHSEEGVPLGSTMIVKFESISAVRKMLESDVYWINNVWDKENTVILPFNPVTPLP